MAKVKNAFFSLDASGSLAKKMTAFGHSGKSYMMYSKRSRGVLVERTAGLGRMYRGVSFYGFIGKYNVRNSSQIQNARRMVFSRALRSYKSLSPSQKQFLTDSAKTLNITGANLYTSNIMDSVFK